MPSTVPNARILTFGYDTKITITHKRSLNKVSDFAKTLMSLLQGKRPPQARSRPIIFVAHSLGGIVVKDMLRQSHETGQQCENALNHIRYDDILKATRAIIFFGTPHRGADPLRRMRKVAMSAAKLAGVRANEAVVDILLPNSEKLADLLRSFSTMAEREKWALFSFQEGYSLGLLFGDTKVGYHNPSAARKGN